MLLNDQSTYVDPLAFTLARVILERHGVVAYTPGQARTTVGGGSTVIAPAVAVPESNVDGSDGCGPTVYRCTRFHRYTTESY